MSNLHPATQLLLFSVLVMFWLVPLSAWWMLKGRQDQKARLWFAGIALYALATTVFAFSRASASPAAYALTFFCSLGSIALMIEAIRRELDASEGISNAGRYLLATSIPAILIPLVLLREEYLGRVIYLVYQSGLQIWLIMLAVRIKRAWGSKALDVVIMAFALYTLTNLARIGEWVISGQIEPLLSFTVLSNVAVTVNLLSVVFYSFGYWGFSLEKAQRSAELSARQALEAQAREQDARHQQAMALERERMAIRMVELGRFAQAGALSASIAHEINQPLASVRLNLESAVAVLNEEAEEGRLGRLLRLSLEENQRAATVIRRIRGLFQGKASEVKLMSVDAVVDQATRLLRQNRRANGVTVDVSLNAPAPIRIADGELIHALINLADNALDSVKATQEGSKVIRISTVQDRETTRIRISDNGVGIPAALRETLFELGISSKPEGMGLGLWLARNIVERNAGRLLLEDSPSGRSSFVIVLPAPGGGIERPG